MATDKKTKDDIIRELRIAAETAGQVLKWRKNAGTFNWEFAAQQAEVNCQLSLHSLREFEAETVDTSQIPA